MKNNQETTTNPRWQPSLRIYLALMNIILLCLLFPTISIYYFQKTASFRDEQLQRTVADRTAALKEKASLLTRSMSHIGSQAISEYNFTFLNDLARNAVLNDSEFIGCQFVRRDSPEAVSAGFGFMGIEQKAYTDFMKGPGAREILVQEQVGEGNQVPVAYIDLTLSRDMDSHPGLIAVTPVYVGDSLWGTVNATFSLKLVARDVAKIQDQWAAQMRRNTMSFLTITVIFMGVGVIFAIILTRPLLRSISLLRAGVDRVSGGDLEHKIFSGDLVCDEFVLLSNSFNEMTQNLQQARKQLDAYSRSLEELVAERTRELKEAQAELLAQAHEAGMAEMAVGVLHNIGNAITPVKVGSTTLIRQLRESPLRKNLKDELAPVPEIIQSAPDITEEKKDRIATILKLLPQSLCEEYDQIIAGLEEISEKHKYIENVISLQMHYARLKGKAELIDINRVAKDTLDMLKEVIMKNGVEVETSFQAVEEVRLEEAKLLQILINLVKNGCEAMSDNIDIPKRLTVSTLQENGDSPEVILSIKDSGCGFTEEEKKHFFTFGYSTKNRGSGFGLHSSANYLIANNGSIEAVSEGPGLGAEFIIHLPAAKDNV